jgi:hypothetical protein
MAAMSPQISERARKNGTAVLRALADKGQTRVAELVGTSETTVSRFKGHDLELASAVLAAAGLKVVPESMICFDPEYVNALRVMAGVGLNAESPRSLEWDTQ